MQRFWDASFQNTNSVSLYELFLRQSLMTMLLTWSNTEACKTQAEAQFISTGIFIFPLHVFMFISNPTWNFFLNFCDFEL